MLGVIDLLNDSLKFRHPGDGQMTVHEKYPATTSQVVVDHLGGFGTLTSTKRDLLALLCHVRVFSESFETGDGIGTLRKDEDKRSRDVTILVRLGQVEDRWLNEWLSHVLHDEVLHSEGDLVGTERLDDNQFLESVQFGIPLTWKRFVLWLERVKDFLEFQVVGNEERIKVFECRESSGHGNKLLCGLGPSKIIEPFSWVLLNLDFTRGTCEEETQLLHIHLIDTL